MSERSKNVIIGIISGAGTGVFMEVLRGHGYLGGASGTIKAVLAGVVAWVIYAAILAIVKLTKAETTKQ